MSEQTHFHAKDRIMPETREIYVRNDIDGLVHVASVSVAWDQRHKINVAELATLLCDYLDRKVTPT